MQSTNMRRSKQPHERTEFTTHSIAGKRLQIRQVYNEAAPAVVRQSPPWASQSKANTPKPHRAARPAASGLARGNAAQLGKAHMGQLPGRCAA